MEYCFGVLLIGILASVILAVLLTNRNASQKRLYTTYTANDGDEILPNGYRRSDYYAYGWSDTGIECWGLDTPAAPDPWAAGFVVWDMQDGEIDGEFDTD